MTILRMRNEDGTITEVEYKRTSVDEQMRALREFANKQGWRQSEIAMWLGQFVQKPKQRLKTYKNLVLLGEVKQ